MRATLRHHSLGLFFGAIFIAALIGQSFAGWHAYNAEQLAQGLSTLSFGSYLTSADFAVDGTENWQSEYLQFLLFVVATIWLFQEGSPESKAPFKSGLESDKDQKVESFATKDSPKWAKVGGIRTTLYSWSLTIVMGSIFLASWFIQSLAGMVAFNEERANHQLSRLSWGDYITNADFWDRTLQNWQSEFLAVGSMVVLSIYLRQRGSPESKPVGESHDATGLTG